MISTDVIIVGAGIAAYSVGCRLCDSGKKVIMLTKSEKQNCNSTLAQGGISVALRDDDNYMSHYEDTLTAGCNLNNKEATLELVKTAPSVIREFIDHGMNFDKNPDSSLSFGKEAAHKLARVIHAGGDRTGLKVMEQLYVNMADRTELHENEPVIDVIIKDGEAVGVVTRTADGKYHTYCAPYVVLATGGIGNLYPGTSNDHTITGDSVALGYRCGAELKNLEFVQFHPTLLTFGGKNFGLITEAVRGDGGVLINEKGEKIMEGVHPLKDLAPRDVVSRTVYKYTLAGEKIYLDISAIHDFKTRFPYVSEICETNGLDLSRNLIPVAPGAHFHMGGVKAKPTGETTVKGLYAVGEAACTGVHGANRLASNSLLEGLVFGRLTADNIISSDRKLKPCEYDFPTLEPKRPFPEKGQIKKVMMDCVGVIRTEEKMKQAIEFFEEYMPDKNGFGRINPDSVTNQELELYNMLTTGWLIAKAAYNRKESFGAHYIAEE
ncbi:MAG: L-aspartate oxidase [Clostridiales bacterium]|nr:L-aspartate oxidase [Clostridiales bacterium]